MTLGRGGVCFNLTTRNNGTGTRSNTRRRVPRYPCTKIPKSPSTIYQQVLGALYRVGQESKPAYFCNNFVYCQPISIIFGTYTL